jgi:signal transduction histidine kinase
MFDKFYRGDANVAQYGAGLGLTICRGIMQAHGGQLWAERFGADSISICFTIPNQGKPPEIEEEKLIEEVNNGSDSINTAEKELVPEINTGETKKAE